MNTNTRKLMTCFILSVAVALIRSNNTKHLRSKVDIPLVYVYFSIQWLTNQGSQFHSANSQINAYGRSHPKWLLGSHIWPQSSSFESHC